MLYKLDWCLSSSYWPYCIVVHHILQFVQQTKYKNVSCATVHTASKLSDSVSISLSKNQSTNSHHVAEQQGQQQRTPPLVLPQQGVGSTESFLRLCTKNEGALLFQTSPFNYVINYLGRVVYKHDEIYSTCLLSTAQNLLSSCYCISSLINEKKNAYLVL